MLKSWSKFNEAKETITREMIQEIMYYCAGSHDGEFSKYIEDALQSTYAQYDENFWENFYEIGYSELNQLIDKWTKIANQTKEIAEATISVYNKIRELKSKFPEIHQIEDEYLDIIEMYGFNMYIDIKEKDRHFPETYMIRLSNWDRHIDMDTFIKLMLIVKSSLKNLSSIATNCDVELYSCLYSADKYGEFKIELNAK
jgi:hypothetical protein